jgi:hypothetical protein
MLRTTNAREFAEQDVPPSSAVLKDRDQVIPPHTAARPT